MTGETGRGFAPGLEEDGMSGMTSEEAARRARAMAAAWITERLESGIWPGRSVDPRDARRLRRAMAEIVRVLTPAPPAPVPDPPPRRRRPRSDLDVVAIADAPTRPRALDVPDLPLAPVLGADPTIPGELDSTLRGDPDATLPPGEPEVER